MTNSAIEPKKVINRWVSMISISVGVHVFHDYSEAVLLLGDLLEILYCK
jgi:hypothetical protein